MAAPSSRPASSRPHRPVPLLAALLLVGVLAATLNCATAAPAHGSSSLRRRRSHRARAGVSLGAPRSTRALLHGQAPVNTTARITASQVVAPGPHGPALLANVSATVSATVLPSIRAWADDAPLTQAAGRALFALSRLQPRPLPA